MNDAFDLSPPGDGLWTARQLDLLVDGELDEAARGELLAALDRTPDGWRRCALAFLEAQSWRQSAQEVCGRHSDERRHLLPASASSRTKESGTLVQHLRRYRTPLAMAATFLVAFALSTALQWQRTPAEGSLPTTPELAVNTGAVADTGTNTMGSATGIEGDLSNVDGASDLPESRWGTVTLVADSGTAEAPRQIDLPVEERDSLDESWFEQPPRELLPQHVERLIEQLGHRVRNTRQFVNVELGDGRTMIVPIDQTEVLPAETPVY